MYNNKHKHLTHPGADPEGGSGGAHPPLAPRLTILKIAYLG
jgi:hypothetical protein